jgi:hypothetical protein
MAISYNWLYDVLSAEERERIRLNIAYKGVMPLIQDWADPATRLPIGTHLKPWGNWWVNCIAPAGIAALAIYGEERTVSWETGWAMARPEDEEEPLSARWVRLVREAMDWFWRFEGGSVPRLEKARMGACSGTSMPVSGTSRTTRCSGLRRARALLSSGMNRVLPPRNPGIPCR